jgi:ribA/ribD-fused uncharacterized protein
MPLQKKPVSALKATVDAQKALRRSQRNQHRAAAVKAEAPEEANDSPIYFFRPTGSMGCFSQWYPSPFSVSYDHFAYLVENKPEALESIRALGERINFSTAEQYMMFGKAIVFSDWTTAAEILDTNDPSLQKALGRRVDGFNQETWMEVCSTVVKRGNVEKFNQNKAEKALLLNTGTRELVEAAGKERIWGIGFGEQKAKATPQHLWGLNLLGKALMAARAELRVNESENQEKGSD